MDYADVVRTINQAYWQTLLENDARAQEAAAQVAQSMGFTGEAARNMIEQDSRGPLSEWLAHRSAAS